MRASASAGRVPAGAGAWVRRVERPRALVVARGKKKARALLKKLGEATEATLLETSRMRAGDRTLIAGELREIRETRGEAAPMSAWEAQMELMREIRALAAEVRELKEELREARRSGTMVAKSAREETNAREKIEKSDSDLMAMLGLGAGDAGAMSEVEDAPLLDVTEWRGDGTDRSSEWPLVKPHDDDIYLMTLVHSKLNDAGFWVGEDDEEDMYFGSSTKEALMYFQATNGIAETGVVDEDTWLALLGEEEYRWGPAPGAIAFDESKFEAENASAPPATTTNPNHFMAEEDYAPDEYDPFGHEDERGEAQGPSFQTSSGKVKHKWPVLREDDGGMEVHKMQVLLAERGYDSGEEDMEYWYFGSATSAALLTFQASERLAETGITDLATWRALLRVETLEESPETALARVGHGDYPNDLARTDRVFLLGEQRYEKSS